MSRKEVGGPGASGLGARGEGRCDFHYTLTQRVGITATSLNDACCRLVARGVATFESQLRRISSLPSFFFVRRLSAVRRAALRPCASLCLRENQLRWQPATAPYESTMSGAALLPMDAAALSQAVGALTVGDAIAEVVAKIRKVEAEIAKVEAEIAKVEAEIEAEAARVEGATGDEKLRLQKREEQLRAEKQQLRAEKQQLRTKEEQLRTMQLRLHDDLRVLPPAPLLGISGARSGVDQRERVARVTWVGPLARATMRSLF